jgi:hypothetical protein
MACSCQDTCVEEGSCCPDYFNAEGIDFKENQTSHDNNKKPVSASANTTLTHTQECVKVQHGRIQNQDGYMMVSSCPPNFDDIEVKRKCEMKIHHSNPFDIIDNVPVTYEDQRQTYKNQYCGQCNLQEDVVPTFWHVTLLCDLQYFAFKSISAVNQFEFIEAVLFTLPGKCNVVFEYETTNISVNAEPQKCTYDTMIDTCNEEHSNTFLQTMCKNYFWPITEQVISERKLYKNYACILCNGVSFREKCTLYKELKPVIIQFTSILNSTRKPSTFDNTSKYDQHVISRYFPNTDGEIRCKKGFAHDIRKVLDRKKMYKVCLCTHCFIQ